MTTTGQLRVEIGTLRVTAASAIEARRLADALPAALARALEAWPDPPAARRSTRRPEAATERADLVASDVVHAALAGLDPGGAVR